MICRWLGIAALGMMAFCSAASAAPVYTLTFSGDLNSGYDSTGLFGTPSYNLYGAPYTVSLSFDPLSLTNDTCIAPNNNCTWNASVTEEVSINGSAFQTFTGTGTIQYGANGASDYFLQFSIYTGANFGGDFHSATALFTSDTNVNDPESLLGVTNASLTSATWNASGTNFSFGANPAALTVSFASGDTDTSSVPEPASLAILGMGLVGLGVFRRRKVKTA